MLNLVSVCSVITGEKKKSSKHNVKEFKIADLQDHNTSQRYALLVDQSFFRHSFNSGVHTTTVLV